MAEWRKFSGICGFARLFRYCGVLANNARLAQNKIYDDHRTRQRLRVGTGRDRLANHVPANHNLFKAAARGTAARYSTVRVMRA